MTRGFDCGCQENRSTAVVAHSREVVWSQRHRIAESSLRLHADTRDVPLLVVASPDYLHAIDQDLIGAAGFVGEFQICS